MMTAERTPILPGWIELPIPLSVLNPRPLAASRWQRGSTCVISTLDMAELPDRTGVGPQWHISVSRTGKRPKPAEVKAALEAFGMQTAEEDNHHPGRARHFWMPVDPRHRVECECKADEQVVVDPDGYRWTQPLRGPCRGCEIQSLTGRPCPIHPEAA